MRPFIVNNHFVDKLHDNLQAFGARAQLSQGMQGLLYLITMGFGAFAFRNRFRFFSIGLFLTLIVIGAGSAFRAGADITQHGFTAPPQWFGLIERIPIYGSMLWVTVLAIVLLCAGKEPTI